MRKNGGGLGLPLGYEPDSDELVEGESKVIVTDQKAKAQQLMMQTAYAPAKGIFTTGFMCMIYFKYTYQLTIINVCDVSPTSYSIMLKSVFFFNDRSVTYFRNFKFFFFFTRTTRSNKCNWNFAFQ